MAAPPEITIEKLSGEYVLNKGLSDSLESLLEMQGIPWMIRKAMGLGTPSLSIKQYDDEKGINHVDIVLTATAGIKGEDCRIVNWSPISKKDKMFGEVIAQSRFYTTFELAGEEDAADAAFLSGKTLADGSAGTWAEEESGKHLQSFVSNESAGWTAEQHWGFEIIDGVRHHTRRMVVRKAGVSKRASQVYDFKGVS